MPPIEVNFLFTKELLEPVGAQDENFHAVYSEFSCAISLLKRKSDDTPYRAEATANLLSIMGRT